MPLTLTELNEKRGKLVHQAREALEEIKGNTDEARAAELEERHDAIMDEMDQLDSSIKREERVAAAEREQEARAEEARRQQRPTPGNSSAPAADEPESLSYRQVFFDYLSRGADLSEMSQEERNVLRAGVVEGAENRAQTTTNAAGGYTVPTELANILVQSMAAWGPMYDDDICTTLNTSSGNVINIPTVDDTAVTAGAHSEGTQMTDDGGKDVTFGQKSLGAFVYDTEWVRFSFELASDSIFNMESLLGTLLGERLGRIANSQLTTGVDATAPGGIVTKSSLGNTAAAATKIKSDEIIDLIHSVDPAYRTAPKVRFMFNDLTLAAIRKLKDGNGNYIWTMGNIQNGAPDLIHGYRYSVNQAMDGIATGNKAMLFGDFGKYFVRKVGTPAIGVKREQYWPDLGIAGLVRLDGELSDTAAVKHLILA